jgi:tetratricopeptide (TPR) repeat protein
LIVFKISNNKEGISRAYENIGRVYARNGKYKEAISVWEKKLPLAENDMEKAWLYHEIGRCHLEIGDYEVARDYGNKSLECAKRINDEIWQLNATVLIAQSEAKMNTVESVQSAIENFEKAIKMSKKQSKKLNTNFKSFLCLFLE